MVTHNEMKDTQLGTCWLFLKPFTHRRAWPKGRNAFRVPQTFKSTGFAIQGFTRSQSSQLLIIAALALKLHVHIVASSYTEKGGSNDFFKVTLDPWDLLPMQKWAAFVWVSAVTFFFKGVKLTPDFSKALGLSSTHHFLALSILKE